MRIAVLFLFLLSVPAVCRAEVIKLKSGQTVEGKVLKQDKDSIQVDAGVDMPVTYFRDEIKQILPDTAAQPAAAPDAAAHADALEARAVELIDAGKMDDGMALEEQAIAIDPAAQRHMNYGSILFGNGVALFKQGQQEQGKDVLRRAEEELKKAIAGFDSTKDAVFLGQTYFLLGEMYANAFGDARQAGDYYRKAVSLSGHDGAKAALARFK